jgi:hypothetical protein
MLDKCIAIVLPKSGLSAPVRLDVSLLEENND